MEMMEGGELFHRISQHRHFTEKMASQVTKQVCACVRAFVCACMCVFAHVAPVYYSAMSLCLDRRGVGTLSLPEYCTPGPEARESALQGQLSREDTRLHTVFLYLTNKDYKIQYSDTNKNRHSHSGPFLRHY